MKTTQLVILVCILCLRPFSVESEELMDTNAIEREVHHFLEEENKLLRSIIANAVTKKSVIIFENGKVNQINLDQDAIDLLLKYHSTIDYLRTDSEILRLQKRIKSEKEKKEQIQILKAELDEVIRQNKKVKAGVVSDVLKSSDAKETLSRISDRLSSEKEIIEKQLDDVVVLRQKVKQLQVELMAHRKLEWLRRGLYGGARKKGGAWLESRQIGVDAEESDLNVQVNRDGTVTIVPVEDKKPEDKETPSKDLKNE